MKSKLLCIHSKSKVLPVIWVLSESNPHSVKTLQHKIQMYLRNLPKKEDTKAKRILACQINKKVQALLGISNFYLSIWNQSWYTISIS